MLHIRVRKRNVEHLHIRSILMNQSCDIKTETTLKHIFLKRDDQFVVVGKIADQLLINRLDESAVCECAVPALPAELISDMLCGADHTSDCEKCDLLALHQNLALSIFNRRVKFLKSTVCLSSRIADCDRSVIRHRKLKIPLKLPQILRGKHTHIRDTGQVRQIKDSLMRLAVTSDKSCTVKCKDNRQILNAHIMKNLVKCTLHK